ncbi:MAG TPA: hypothetical protein VGA85_03085 [Dehalococcoidales bacterium]
MCLIAKDARFFVLPGVRLRMIEIEYNARVKELANFLDKER